SPAMTAYCEEKAKFTFERSLSVFALRDDSLMEAPSKHHALAPFSELAVLNCDREGRNVLRGAIIGFGEVARHGHWPAYAHCHDAKIVAMVDRTEERRKAARE